MFAAPNQRVNAITASLCVDGEELLYCHNDVNSKPGKQVLVLVHGAGGSHQDWPLSWRGIDENVGNEGQLSSVEPHSGLAVSSLRELAVYAIDLPGHGQSKGKSVPSIHAYGSKIAKFLQALNLHNVCLAGHSMGVPVVLEASLLSLERVTSLCLIAGAARMPVIPELFEGLRKNTPQTVNAIARACWHERSSDHNWQVTKNRMLASGSNTLINDFLACDAVDLRGRLHEINIPALVIASDEDRMVHIGEIKAMSDALPRSKMHVHSGCGHFLHVERSKETLVDLEIFFEGPIEAHD